MYFDKLWYLRTKRAKMMTLWTRRLMFRHSNVKPSIFLFDLNGIEWRSNYKFSEKALTHLLCIVGWYIHKICTKKIYTHIIRKCVIGPTKAISNHILFLSKSGCCSLNTKKKILLQWFQTIGLLSSLDKANIYFFSEQIFSYLKQGIK